MRTILIIAGTRPEAIKLAPVVHALRRASALVRPVVCLTGQHRELVDDLLKPLGLTADHNLRVMCPGQSINEVAQKVLSRLPAVLALERPDIALVQGDTVSAAIGALAAFYAGVRVGHVEAGLRTGCLDEPFPEEGNRRLIAAISSIHYAPTEEAAENLRREGIPEELIEVTGNTGLDSFKHVLRNLPSRTPEPLRGVITGGRPLVLVTVHRRENQTHHLLRICDGVRRVADECNVQVVFPVHPSPAVRAVVTDRLGSHDGVSIIEPLDYVSTVWLVARQCALVMTDSGGLQEEAAAVGCPVLVLRNTTDRPEGVRRGCAILVGSEVDTIVFHVKRILHGEAASEEFIGGRDAYGDGHAADRIATSLVRLLHSPMSGSPHEMAIEDAHRYTHSIVPEARPAIAASVQIGHSKMVSELMGPS